MNPRHRGLSLAEVLVAIALFAMISSFIALLIRDGFAYMRHAETRAELQRTSLFVLSNLSKEISESSPDCIRYGGPTEPPEGLVYGSPRGADDQVTYQGSHLKWKKWVCVYWDKNLKLLLRLEEPLLAPTVFKPDPSPAGLNKSTAGFAAMNGVGRRVLARNVSNFQASGGREVTLALEVEVMEGHQRSRLGTRTGIRPNH